MALWINDSGASTEEIERGVAAAQAVFDQHGVSAEDASAAKLKIDSNEPVSSVETMRAVAWDAADSAAVIACCKGWQRIPEAAHLELA